MRGLRRWPGYAALNRPLMIIGVERRAFLLVATLALGLWNATASLVAGAVVFAVGWGAGWLAGRRDPEMLAVLRAAARYPARFDPGKWAERPWHLVLRSGR
ncbi:MAG: VirB3 family type IV secretion system protein [Gammaproteobacteria bacterium]|nr:VirB3 family type IV secretion system protein [Gammaproteobacteria bacterium]MDE0249285.1 VirB3 family type IV secretion system protein [Gammaproteobacteria bacterium]